MACYREVCFFIVFAVTVAAAITDNGGALPLPYANSAVSNYDQEQQAGAEADQDQAASASSYSSSYPDTQHYVASSPESYSLQGYENYIVPAMASAYGISNVKPGWVESVKPHLTLLWAFLPKIALAVGAVAGLLAVGTLLATSVCAFTHVCHLSFLGHRLTGESVRGFVTPDRISELAHLVQTSVAKYQDLVGKTKRAAITTNEVKK